MQSLMEGFGSDAIPGLIYVHHIFPFEYQIAFSNNHQKKTFKFLGIEL